MMPDVILLQSSACKTDMLAERQITKFINSLAAIADGAIVFWGSCHVYIQVFQANSESSVCLHFASSTYVDFFSNYFGTNSHHKINEYKFFFNYNTEY